MRDKLFIKSIRKQIDQYLQETEDEPKIYINPWVRMDMGEVMDHAQQFWDATTYLDRCQLMWKACRLRPAIGEDIVWESLTDAERHAITFICLPHLTILNTAP